MSPTSGTVFREVYRRTDDPNPGAPRLELLHETLQAPLPETCVVIKVHAISLNYRDANMVHGSNPWPILPKGIPCSDAAGEIVFAGTGVKTCKIGDRVSLFPDQANFTGREPARSWLAADVDGVLADYLRIDESLVCKIPDCLDYDEASTLPCAGLTAWTAIKGMEIGQSILIQGTGGVSMMALKLARAVGCRIIVSSSSDAKLKKLCEQYPYPPLSTVNYATCSTWDEEVMKLTAGVGVDLVLENGGTQSLIRSLKCTKRGGVISQVGYLGKQDAADLDGMISLLIDRRINLRGINVGSKLDFEDLNQAVSATNMRFHDIIDSTFSFDEAPRAIEYVWQSRQVGKVVIRTQHHSGYQPGTINN